MDKVIRNGFTLIEVTVIVGVTLMLTGGLILMTSGGRQEIALAVERAKIGQFIARAKSLTVNTYLESPTTCGFGIQFDYANRQYQMFRYEDPNPDPSTVCAAYNPFAAIVPIAMPQTLSADVVYGSGPNPIWRVGFLAPDPKTFILNYPSGIPMSGTGYISLQTRAGVAGPVSVNTFGQISF